jgi:hypothetical protein
MCALTFAKLSTKLITILYSTNEKHLISVKLICFSSACVASYISLDKIVFLFILTHLYSGSEVSKSSFLAAFIFWHFVYILESMFIKLILLPYFHICQQKTSKFSKSVHFTTTCIYHAVDYSSFKYLGFEMLICSFFLCEYRRCYYFCLHP